MKLEIIITLNSPGNAEILAGVRRLINQGIAMSAQSKELLDIVKQIPGAIDGFEARITEILKTQGADTPETVADVAEAISTLRAALADAADGVDEAATTVPTP